MIKDDILTWLEQVESAVLAFDTNAIFGRGHASRFAELCDAINRINDLRAPRTIHKVLSSAVYMEKLHDMRQAFGPGFDPSLIHKFLESKGIEVIAFAQRDAERAAELIGRSYPSSDAWHSFKRRRCLECLGLQKHADLASGTGQGCGATIDWLVAGHADAHGCLLVTNDSGPEFHGIARKSTLEAALGAAQKLLDRLGAASRAGSSP